MVTVVMLCPSKGPKIFGGWSKFFGPDQKLIYILCQFQKFRVTPKDCFHSVNLVFVLAKKFLKRNEVQLNVWTGSKNLDQYKKNWDL